MSLLTAVWVSFTQVIASQGLWQVMTGDDVVQFVDRYGCKSTLSNPVDRDLGPSPCSCNMCMGLVWAVCHTHAGPLSPGVLTAPGIASLSCWLAAGDGTLCAQPSVVGHKHAESALWLPGYCLQCKWLRQACSAGTVNRQWSMCLLLLRSPYKLSSSGSPQPCR